jgi:membrane-associated phospholipid phosphatase
MQTPSTAAGAVGVASQPTRARRSSQPDARSSQAHVRDRRDRFDPDPGGAAEHLAERLDDHSPAVGAALMTLAAYIALSIVMIGLGLVLTKIVFDGSSGWDVEVNRWFAHRRTATWNDVSNYGSHAAETLTVIGIAAVVVLILAARRCWREISFLVIALVLEVSVFVTAAFFVDRPRPPVVRLDDAPPTSSFPSGHTAAAVVLYVGLALIVTARVRNPIVRLIAWIVAIVAPLFVAGSRLYRGMHFPSDVMSGALLGFVCLAVALFVVRTAVAVARRREVTA